MEEPSVFSGEVSSISSRRSPISKPSPTNGPSGSKFKGVVSQPNGHWGSQIYANHQRIWLGTFKSERDAAMAYDSAAIKLRNGPTNRNFPLTNVTVLEPSFQDQFSTETILTMIKDGSYNSKFSDYLRAQDRLGYHLQPPLCGTPGVNLHRLFQKELTPSDVSKLNRLVIPKKHALKYFPRIADARERDRGSVEDMELMFFERSMKSWNFRYCYWKSSQSFVFTRGWNRFAKEKGLRSRDRVIFSSYECNGNKLCIIDVEYDAGARAGTGGDGDSKEEIGVGVIGLEGGGNELEREGLEMMEDVDATLSCNEQERGFKLFGFFISS